LISNGSEELSKRPGKSLQAMIHENGAPRTTRRRGTISVKTNPQKNSGQGNSRLEEQQG